ncbi:dehydrodolichyl diphosphate synthase 3-like [Raphanus sativus]|uniref:Alkyl transferase n=1 Tax=Raphanus sativus TaxID=3726 RepID=A0A6J0MWP3_RAPSA|nr:dehydrodolichyl diphosphate synthase 3-like [Raphanus sativus]
MVSLFSVVFTGLALILIPGLFISWRLSVPISFKNVLGFIKLITSRHDDEEERNEKRDEGTYVNVGEEGTTSGLVRELMPRHVAVIMDGNRRWAERGGLLTLQGHEAGAKRLLEFADLCFKLGIETVSAFAFSTENWGRQKVEVNCLMFLFERYLSSKLQYFKREEIRVSVIGNLEKIPESLLRTIKELKESTKSYKKKHLILAIDYSGRFDILQACKNLMKKSQQGLISEEDVDETLFEGELVTKCAEFPSPDLLIRTSGEQRISNFFLWQLAYTELFFSPVLWPDFNEDKLLEALVSYQCRERRFGRRL